MKAGNRLGLWAVAALAAAACAALSQRPTSFPILIYLATILEIVSLVLFVTAGVKGSRWWFAIPVIFISVWIVVMSRGM